MNIDGLLFDHRLFIDSYYEDFAGLFCNLTGQKTSLTKDRFLLSSWYEGYLYTVIIGIQVNEREDYKGRKVDKAPKWSSHYMRQYKYAISQLLAREDILNELDLLDYESITKSEVNAKKILDDVKKICDEFSNGGLKHLYNLYGKDNTIFNEYNSLENLFRNAKTS